jgi:Asp-tRNA(Asn)/Glu-tRNA(Gln) amidotransferase A subunit family amidase
MPDTSLVGVRDALRGGALSSVELVRATLAAIDAHAGLSAFLTVDHDGALAAAATADAQRAGGGDAPLLGVPVAIKDLQETRGLVTTYGSVRFADNVPAEDCIAVERIRRAGAVIIGKTNTPVFGLLGETKNRLAADARNPWNPALTTGGSSGGSAAAVAAGIVAAATGTDSAGSITAPSAMCGVFGLKPTLGRVPSWPLPDDSLLFLTHGPITRSVADAVVLLQVMSGHDPRDPLARRDTLGDLDRELARATTSRPLAGLRVAWSADLGFFAVDDEVRMISETLAAVTSELGARLAGDAPRVEHPLELYFPIFAADTRRGVLPIIDRDELYPESVAEAAAYPALTAEQYIGLLRRLWQFRSNLDVFFDQHDVLVTPATATAAFPVGEPPAVIGGRPVAPGWMTFMPFSAPWNLGMHPTASVPAGLTRDGRPVGLMLIAPPGREDRVVRVAAALEHARPWPLTAPAAPA